MNPGDYREGEPKWSFKNHRRKPTDGGSTRQVSSADTVPDRTPKPASHLTGDKYLCADWHSPVLLLDDTCTGEGEFFSK